MTTVSFYTEDGRITGFDCKGHSGYGSAGADIVCAAVTSAVRMTECAVCDVLGLKAAVMVGEEESEISFRLPKKPEERDDEISQVLMTALMVYLEQLHQEYPDNITVMEV
jgi:uncharacterized protein YsxB (DUF464 family)